MTNMVSGLATSAPVAGRLLLVDDEENILSSLKRLLRRDGYQIHTANSGREGLEVLAREVVDVIVSDQRMPNMTGTEFLRQVKERYPDTVRIVLSGYTELESVTGAINEGAVFRFLTKPWNDEHLRQQIADAVRHKRIGDENLRLQRDLQQANEKLKELLEERQRRLELGEASLRFSHEVMSSLPLAVVGIDNDQLVVLANTAAETLFGRPVTGLPAEDVLPPALLQAIGSDDPVPLQLNPATSARVVQREVGGRGLKRGHLFAFFIDRS